MSNYEKQLKELELKIYRNVVWGIGILLGLVVIAIFFAGCVSRYAIFQHPDTKDRQVCKWQGWGWLGAPYALHNQEKCEDNLKEIGYIEDKK